MAEPNKLEILIKEQELLSANIEKLKEKKKIFRNSSRLSEVEKEINRESMKILNSEIERLRKRFRKIERKLKK